MPGRHSRSIRRLPRPFLKSTDALLSPVHGVFGWWQVSCEISWGEVGSDARADLRIGAATVARGIPAQESPRADQRERRFAPGAARTASTMIYDSFPQGSATDGWPAAGFPGAHSPAAGRRSDN